MSHQGTFIKGTRASNWFQLVPNLAVLEIRKETVTETVTATVIVTVTETVTGFTLLKNRDLEERAKQREEARARLESIVRSKLKNNSADLQETLDLVNIFLTNNK